MIRMAPGRTAPKSIDEYIAGFSHEVQAILEMPTVDDQERNRNLPSRCYHFSRRISELRSHE